jgi:hypothetical protein
LLCTLTGTGVAAFGPFGVLVGRGWTWGWTGADIVRAIAGATAAAGDGRGCVGARTCCTVMR